MARGRTGDDGEAYGTYQTRQAVADSLPGAFDRAGIRRVDEYIDHHSTALNAYHDNIFGNTDDQRASESVLRDNGQPTEEASRPPV